MNKMHVTIPQNQLDSLKEYLKSYLVNINNDEAFFYAVRNNSRIYAYDDGKIEIIGSGAFAIARDIEYFINQDMIYNAHAIFCEGLNDLFGPLVFCSSYFSKNDLELVEKLNINLNKKITDYQVSKLAPFLIKNIKHNFIVIDAKVYNQMLDKNIKKEQILAHYAYLMATKVAEKNSLIIVDSFTDSANFYSYNQSKKNLPGEFAFYDNSIAVHYSALISQIIARYIFIQKLGEYSTSVDTFLIKGNTEFTKEQFTKLSEELDDKILDIAKKNYF